MLDGYWPINYTFEDRYELTGIIDLMFEHVEDSKKKKFVVVDIGCSYGLAMKYAQNHLKQKGLDLFTIGIDFSKNVVDEAKKNLDKFINADVFSVNTNVENVDIVVCSKAAIFVTGDVRYKIIRKCIEFLKKDGILITDVDCFEKPKLSDDLKLIQYVFPTLSCFKNGIKGFRKEYRRRLHFRFRKKMKKMNKNDALTFAEEILSAWNNLSYFKKLDWKITILTQRIINHQIKL